MPTVLLIRHGRTASNAKGVLAGWTPGVSLDDTGRAQAGALAQRMAVLPISLAVSSPLQRCQETARILLAEDGPDQHPRPELLTDDRLGECRYGDWTGKSLQDLAKEPLWRVVQAHPSAAVFPGEDGEAMLTMQHRAVSAIREYDAKVAAEHGDDAIWIALSHGDVVKAILADALGMHLDAFQRLVVDPASVSVVRFTPLRPFAVRVNDSGNDLAALVPPPPKKRRAGTRRKPVSSDAVVGGSAGTADASSPSTAPSTSPNGSPSAAPNGSPSATPNGSSGPAKRPSKRASTRVSKRAETGGSASGPGTT